MQKPAFLLISFLAGLAAMAFELTAVRQAEPFFGSSYQVWAACFAAVLTGYALGYFLGGFLAKRARSGNWLMSAPVFSLVWMAFFSAAGSACMEFFWENFSTSGIIPYAMISLVPAVTFMASLNPVLVQCGNSAAGAGSLAGTLFAVSTVGGISGLLLFGFWVIPSGGIVLAFAAIAFLLVLVTFIAVSFAGKYTRWISVAGSLAAAFVLTRPLLSAPLMPDFVKFRQTTLSGELLVAELPFSNTTRRMLFHNRIAQTNMDMHTGTSLWDYSHLVATLAGAKPEGARVLLLGLAGGDLVKEFRGLKFEVTAVEIDPRMKPLAEKYFFLPPDCRVITDDARHFIKTTEEKFDLIVFDLFAGEGQPAHIITREALFEAKNALNPDGWVILNVHGFVQGKEGIGVRSIWKTLAGAGFHVYYTLTPGVPESRNTEILASADPLPGAGTLRFRQNGCCTLRMGSRDPVLSTVSAVMYEDGILLTDDRPVLDLLNRDAYKSWRKYAVENYLLPLKKQGLPYY